jgi:hypothetical protein
MEKLDFTPEEWREQEGLGWPPESESDFIKHILAELRAKYPDQDIDAAISRSLNRDSERRRAKEMRQSSEEIRV